METHSRPNAISWHEASESGLSKEPELSNHQCALLRRYLFESIDADKYVYAVLEAGASVKSVTSELVAALEDYDPPQWRSLLRIQDDPGLAQLAPYLIEMEPDHSDMDAKIAGLTHFTEWLLSHPDLPRWGFFAVSSRSFEDILDYLARFAVVELENGETAFFRFANPAFFSTLLSSLRDEEIAEMGEYLERVCLFDSKRREYLRVLDFSERSFSETESFAGNEPLRRGT